VNTYGFIVPRLSPLKKGQLSGFKIKSDWSFNRKGIEAWRLQQHSAIEETPQTMPHALTDKIPVEQ
jgi:hypothetical protein